MSLFIVALKISVTKLRDLNMFHDNAPIQKARSKFGLRFQGA